ncbi:pyrroline-5-carboxylate reductase [bacterium]|nr:pyrroline-5-carboxylate reductase [bacterium]
MKKLFIIGVGNMGTSILKGIIPQVLKENDISVYDVDKSRLRPFLDSKIEVVDTIEKGAKNAESILLAVKPQNMEDVLMKMGGAVSERNLIISIAAGVTTNYIKKILGGNTKVARVMPNLCVSVKKGASACCFSIDCTNADKQFVESLFKALGITLSVDESKMNIITAISGSGPGYLFKIMEVLIDIGKKEGLKEEDSRKLVLQTVSGAVSLAMNSNISARELRERVTSKAGTTEAALKVMDEYKIEEMFQEAVKVALNRAKELSKE